MKYKFHPNALEEYTEATLYYLKISSSLANSFIKQIEIGIKRSQIIRKDGQW